MKLLKKMNFKKFDSEKEIFISSFEKTIEKNQLSSSFYILSFQYSNNNHNNHIEFIGFFLSRNLFITKINEKNNEEINKKILLLKQKTCFLLTKTTKIHMKIRKISRIHETNLISIVILYENTYVSNILIDYIQISTFQDVCLSYGILKSNEKEEVHILEYKPGVYYDFIVKSYNDYLYVTTIGNLEIDFKIICKIEEIFKKSMSSLDDYKGIAYLPWSRLIFQFNIKVNSIFEEKKENFDMKKYSRFQIEEVLLETCSLNDDYIKRNLFWLRNSQLKVLNLGNNRLSQTMFLYFSLSFSRMNDLLYLDLSMNDIGYKGMTYFSEILMPHIEYIDLRFNNILSKGMELLSKMKIPYLKTLKIGNNQLKTEGFLCLTYMNIPNISYLDISFNEISFCLDFLLNFNFSLLKSIDFGFNSFNLPIPKSIQLIKSMISSLTLTHLSLYENSISYKQIRFLSSITFPCLLSLNIRNNNISHRGLKYLSHMNLSSLQELYLYDNQIGNKGMKHLSHMQLPSLTILYLNNNEIGKEGIRFFSKMNLPFLKRLSLQCNFIDDKGLFYLSKMKISRLKYLNVYDNDFSIKGKKYLKGMSVDSVYY